MQVSDLLEVVAELNDPRAASVAEAARTALGRVEAIGLGYLSLDRATLTLSGGEGQRLKLVGHLGSGLSGMTYVFDEPSTGLHPHDVGRLTDLLRALRDEGNTVLVVEHDPDVIAVADRVVKMGRARASTAARSSSRARSRSCAALTRRPGGASAGRRRSRTASGRPPGR